MPKPQTTNGREGVTRDTPLGVCHVTSRCPTPPTVTHRDNVTPCHAVTHLRWWAVHWGPEPGQADRLVPAAQLGAVTQPARSLNGGMP